MRTVLALAIAAIGLGIIAVSAAVFGVRAPVHPGVVDSAWTEAKWPFPIDQWGVGRAFACAPEDCGAKVDLTGDLLVSRRRSEILIALAP